MSKKTEQIIEPINADIEAMGANHKAIKNNSLPSSKVVLGATPIQGVLFHQALQSAPKLK